MGLSRNENILENILGEQNDLDEPQSRIETLLMELLDMLSEHGELSATSDGNGTITIEVK